MDISTDIAASASAYKAMETQMGVSAAMMKQSMDAQTEIASQLIDMLSLNVGLQIPQALDMMV